MRFFTWWYSFACLVFGFSPVAHAVMPRKDSQRGNSQYSAVVAGKNDAPIDSSLNNYIDSALEKLRKDIRHDFETALEQKINTMVLELSNQNKQINMLKTVIRQQQNALLEFKRKELNTNIIIHGIPERESSGPADDIKSVQEIFSEIEVANDIIPSSQHRLGKPNFAQGKPRPLKVVLHSTEQRNKVLQNAKNLRSTTAFKTVFINRDEPKEDRIENNRLRSALKEQKKTNPEVKLIRGKLMLQDTVLDYFDPLRQLFRADD